MLKYVYCKKEQLAGGHGQNMFGFPESIRLDKYVV